MSYTHTNTHTHRHTDTVTYTHAHPDTYTDLYTFYKNFIGTPRLKFAKIKN